MPTLPLTASPMVGPVVAAVYPIATVPFTWSLEPGDVVEMLTQQQ
mgnify:CR=1 FL=1